MYWHVTFYIMNVSNIKKHVFILDIKKIWSYKSDVRISISVSKFENIYAVSVLLLSIPH